MRCRFLLAQDEKCDVCDDRVLSLADDRDAISKEVWRTRDSKKRSLLPPAIATGLAAVLGAAEGGLYGLGVAAGVTAASYGVLGLLFRSSRPRPRGAHGRPKPPAASATGIVSEVKDAEADTFVAGAASYLVFSLKSAHVGVTLRRGRCRTVVIACDDGRRVEVPAGRCRIESRAAEQDELNKVEAARLLIDIEPHDDLEESLFPFDAAYRVDLRRGDRVELLGDLAPISRDDPSYRESAHVGSRFVATPWFRILARA